MKKMFLEDLPKWGNDNNKYNGKINWNKSIGGKVRFIYEEIDGVVEIVSYDSKTRKITLKYNSNIDTVTHVNFRNCHIGNLVEKTSREFRFNVGDIIEDVSNGKLKIISQKTIKDKDNWSRRWYEYLCLSCGEKDVIMEKSILKRHGCSVCCNQKVKRGFNDLWLTHPEVAELLDDKNIGYTVTQGTNHFYKFKCPFCGFIKKDRINTVVRYGLSCPKCSDGISYPEKFMFNVLDQLNLNFEYQKSDFEWVENKRYDFYIPSLEYIIEVHGMQHYDRSFNGIKTVGEEQENDTLKEALAKENGILKYIIIDCRYSRPEFIKVNILQSEMKNLFDLSKINWLKCHEFACKSLVKTVCEIWNNEVKNTLEIANRLNLTRATIIKYLKQGAKLGLCDYDSGVCQDSCRIFLVC